jgi:hypothetical protein
MLVRLLSDMHASHPPALPLCLQQPQNWQTTVGLPFFRIESTVRVAVDRRARTIH